MENDKFAKAIAYLLMTMMALVVAAVGVACVIWVWKALVF